MDLSKLLVSAAEGRLRAALIALLGVTLGVALTLAVISLYTVLRARWQRRRAGGSALGQGAPLLRDDSLSRIWRRFFLALPYAVRAAVRRFPNFVVFGPGGAGKTQLISTRVDWQGQSSQFLPSFTDDPLLQIYLGRQVVAHEVSVQVLYDTSPRAERALRRLWSPLYTRRPPVVVVALRQPALALATPDDLTRLGQLLRGKLNLLGSIAQGPIEVRVVLTHMDQLTGYPELSRLLTASGVSLDLDLGAALSQQEGGLQEAVRAFERYLPLALTSLNVAEFRAAVEFLRQAPAHFAGLETLLKPLCEGSAGFAAPVLERLYFQAPSRTERGGNPFHAARAPMTEALRRPMLPPALYAGRWHLLGCALFFLLTGVILGGALLSHRRVIAQAEDAVERFSSAVRRAEGGAYDSAIVRAAEKDTRLRVDAVRASEARWVYHRWIYQERKAALVRDLLGQIRKGYLLPLLERYSDLHDIERVVNVLAVLYACRDNQLGALVMTELRDLATSLALSEGVVDTYVSLCTTPFTGVASVPWAKLGTTTLGAGALSEQTWLDYFTVLDRAFQAPRLTPAQLQTLQAGARPLMEIADLVGKNRHLMQVFRVLVEDSPLIDLPRRMGTVHPALNPPRWLRDQNASLSGVLHMVHDTRGAAEGGGPMDLRQVLLLLTELGERDKAPDRVYNFELKDRAFSFSARFWLDLMMRSRHQDVLRRTARRADPGEVDEEDDTDLADLEDTPPARTAPAAPPQSARERRPSAQPTGSLMELERLEPGLEARPDPREGARPRRKGRGRKGRARVDEELPAAPAPPRIEAAREAPESGAASRAPPLAYTRVGFEQDTKVVLQKLAAALGDQSKLPPQQRALVTRYIEDEATAYALRYCRAALRQHKSYTFPTEDIDIIHNVLQEMLQPGGSLLLHLRRTVDNVNLTDLQGPFFKPLVTCLSGFRPLVVLMMPDKEGGYPGLKPYVALVANLLRELDTGKPPVERDDSKPVSLTDLLSPLGRIGLSALTEQESSILRQADHFFDTNGLRGPLSQPMMLPLQQVARLGVDEVERVLQQQWQTLLEPQVRALLSRYPFDRSAAAEVEPAALDALTPERGTFWVAFRQIFGAVCVERDGEWAPRSRGRLPAALPAGMLDTVNQLERISRRLYSRDGKRQPIVLRIRPLPATSVREGIAPSATYLSVGRVQIFGMNEAPVTRIVGLVWWQQDVAAVGAEFAAVGSGQRQTQSLEVGDSQWSFYRLLDRGRLSTGGVMTWRLSAGPRTLASEVRFVLENDPWEPFRLERQPQRR